MGYVGSSAYPWILFLMHNSGDTISISGYHVGLLEPLISPVYLVALGTRTSLSYHTRAAITGRVVSPNIGTCKYLPTPV